MGNTPEPCDTCKYLYADCMHKDDPAYDAECKLDMPMGEKDCPKYWNYNKSNNDGKWIHPTVLEKKRKARKKS